MTQTVRMLLVCPGSYNRGNRQAEKEGTEAKPPMEYFSILTGSAAQTAGQHRRTCQVKTKVSEASA